jgi:hypothetical protein
MPKNALFEHERGTEREQKAVLGLLAVGAPHAALEPHAHHANQERRHD